MRRPAADPLEEFLALYFHDPAVGILRAQESKLLRELALAAPLLDLGAGDGSFAARTLAAPAQVGVDRDLRRLRAARRTGAYRHLVAADAHRLPFRDGAFAAVLSNSTLEHIPGVGDVLRECRRVLEPGGELVFTVHNHRFARRMFFWPGVFARLGRGEWTSRYRSRRLRRLAMENLLNDEEWRERLAAAGLETAELRGYLSGRADRAFEILLVLARFGVGRAHIGAALRLADRALARFGIGLHRRLAGRLLARLLRTHAEDAGGEPAAILVRARRALPAGAVIVELARYRARTGS